MLDARRSVYRSFRERQFRFCLRGRLRPVGLRIVSILYVGAVGVSRLHGVAINMPCESQVYKLARAKSASALGGVFGRRAFSLFLYSTPECRGLVAKVPLLERSTSLREPNQVCVGGCLRPEGLLIVPGPSCKGLVDPKTKLFRRQTFRLRGGSEFLAKEGLGILFCVENRKTRAYLDHSSEAAKAPGRPPGREACRFLGLAKASGSF